MNQRETFRRLHRIKRQAEEARKRLDKILIAIIQRRKNAESKNE